MDKNVPLREIELYTPDMESLVNEVAEQLNNGETGETIKEVTDSLNNKSEETEKDNKKDDKKDNGLLSSLADILAMLLNGDIKIEEENDNDTNGKGNDTDGKEEDTDSSQINDGHQQGHTHML